MTIHHDKLAYGKIASNKEDLSEERLKEMLKLLNAVEEEDCSNSDSEHLENPEQSSHKTK